MRAGSLAISWEACFISSRSRLSYSNPHALDLIERSKRRPFGIGADVLSSDTSGFQKIFDLLANVGLFDFGPFHDLSHLTIA